MRKKKEDLWVKIDAFFISISVAKSKTRVSTEEMHNLCGNRD